MRRRPDKAAALGAVAAPATPIVDRGQVAVQRHADASILHVEAAAQRGGFGAKLRNVTIDPLDWYLHRGQITREQYAAGDRVRTLQYAAHGSGYATVNLGSFHGGSRAGNWRFSSRQAHAMRELGDVMAVLKGGERLMLERVVLWGEFANAAAQRMGLRPRQGIAVLRQALSRLAEEQRY